LATVGRETPPFPPAARPTASAGRRRWLWIAGGAASLIALLVLPRLMPGTYQLHLLNMAGIYVIAVLGLNFIFGWTGQISLGHAALWGLGAYASALLTTRLGWPFVGGLAAAVVLTGLFGVVVGIPTLRLRGHYLAMATVGVAEIVRIVLVNWEPVTGGALGVKNIPPATLGPLVFRSELDYYYLILAAALLALLGARQLQHSTFGRILQAIRDSEIAAEVMGVNAPRYKVLAFALSAMYAGVAGSLYAHLSGYISPDTYGFDQTVVFVTMLVLGGAGSLLGCVLGAVLLTFLPEWLRGLKDYYMVIYGVSVLLLMVFLPTGIVGLLRGLLARQASVWGPMAPAGRPPADAPGRADG
jgi:branched-chain amino acid transport system permease protein